MALTDLFSCLLLFSSEPSSLDLAGTGKFISLVEPRQRIVFFLGFFVAFSSFIKSELDSF